MPSEEAIRQHVLTLVRNSDLTIVTAKQIRRKIEHELQLEQDELASPLWKGVVKSAIDEAMIAIEHERKQEEPKNKAKKQKNQDKQKELERGNEAMHNEADEDEQVTSIGFFALEANCSKSEKEEKGNSRDSGFDPCGGKEWWEFISEEHCRSCDTTKKEAERYGEKSEGGW